METASPPQPAHQCFFVPSGIEIATLTSMSHPTAVVTLEAELGISDATPKPGREWTSSSSP